MQGSVLPGGRDLAILRSFRDRVDPGDPGAFNNLGVLYFTKGMTDEAVASFTRALELDPRMTVAQRNLEIACFTSGFYDRRVEELSRRLAESPSDRAARWELGRTFFLLGDVTRAMDAFSVLLRETPDDVTVIRQVATAEARCGDLEGAARWLQHALEVEPDNAAVLFQLGEVAYQRGLNEEARAALARSLELAPDDADALYLLGFVLGDQGRHEEARDAARKALRLNPSLGRAQASLSLERFDRRSWERAREVREARGLVEGTRTPQAAHYALGLAFRHKGYFAEALKEFRIAREQGEDPVLVQQAMAEVHLLRGEMAAAEALYDTLLGDQPQNPRWWNERGVTLHHAGHYEGALASYEHALDANAGYARAWNNLGVAAFHAGQVPRAIEALEYAATLPATATVAHLNLALALTRQGAWARALAAYRAVLTPSPDHAGAWNGVGLVLMQLGRQVEARTAFSRAVEARPGYAEAHYNLGFVLGALGDHTGALRETQRALELDSYYTPQKFELATEIDESAIRIQVAAEISGVRRDETVESFTFEEEALESFFTAVEGREEPAAPRATDVSYATARALLASGDLDGAVSEARRVMGRGGSRAEGLQVQGEAFLSRGAAGEALERFREARLADADSAEAVRGEVRALMALRRFADAEGPVTWLIANASRDVSSLLLIAEVQRETDRPALASATLDLAETLSPDAVEVPIARARLARGSGDTAAALDALGAATARRPRDLALQVDRAELLAEAGHLAEAEASLLRVVRQAGTRPGAVLALARVQRAASRASETIEPLVAYLLDDPYQLDVLASLGESLVALGRDADASVAFARIRRFDPAHAAALYFTGVLATRHDDEGAARACWQQVMEVEPAGHWARQAAAALRTLDAAAAPLAEVG